jgi:hypothetical protein
MNYQLVVNLPISTAPQKIQLLVLYNRGHVSAAVDSARVFLELQIQISAGQFWQHNRGNIGIRQQPPVG